VSDTTGAESGIHEHHPGGPGHSHPRHSHPDGHGHDDPPAAADAPGDRHGDDDAPAGGHGHPHSGSTETLPDPSGPGSVLVDIGGDVGAAVVTTPPSLDGEEIEIRPDPGEWTGRHVAVRPRPLPDRTI
jgi:hypothetical protein